MEQLILNNGTIIEGHLIETGGNLFLYMYGISLQIAFEQLNNPQNVVSIQWKNAGDTVTVTGYKHLHSIAKESATLVTAMLRKWDYDV